MTLESKIDDLYRGSLDEFTANRTALAKTLSGADAQRVKKLAKPTIAPWAINQVYWRARPVYDRIVKTGETLRHAQLAALEGRKSDVRAAVDDHRAAIADAVRHAEQYTVEAGSVAPTDALNRTFEALSLSSAPPEPPGRMTRPLQPAGFEALAGIAVKAPPKAAPTKADAKREADARKREEAERKREDAERRKHEAAVKKAEEALQRAKQQMRDAEAALRRTRDQSR